MTFPRADSLVIHIGATWIKVALVQIFITGMSQENNNLLHHFIHTMQILLLLLLLMLWVVVDFGDFLQILILWI